MSYKQPLGKGGKIIQKKKEESGPDVALAKNTQTLEKIQEEVLSGVVPKLPAHDLITDILGTTEDGQFRVEIEKYRLIRQGEHLLTIQKSKSQAVVPARFLKNAGKKNAKIIVPDLIKIGAFVSCHLAMGCGSVKKVIAMPFAPSYTANSYAEIQYILPAEKEEAWGALGVCQTSKEETKRLVRDNALVPEEKRKPAKLILEAYSAFFNTCESSVEVAL